MTSKFDVLVRNEHKFWKHVNRGSGCWEWTSHANSQNYGAFQFRDSGIKYYFTASRAAFILANRRFLVPSEFVCHTCDNPICVRPDHLFVGKANDNSSDMVNKDRSAHSEDHPKSKLTTEQVLRIRARHAAGETQASIRRDFGLAKDTVHKIVHGKTWTRC